MSLKKEFDDTKYKEHIDERTWLARSFELNLVVILVFFKQGYLEENEIILFIRLRVSFYACYLS